MNRHTMSLVARIMQAIKDEVTADGGVAYIRDPVFGIVRNRVHAEVAKAMLRTGDDSLVGPILDYVIGCQNPDGSWNEVHVNYNQPSALITAFIGDALLEAADRYPHEEALMRARDFVTAAERRPGYFLKSEQYTADHLNVDASCGAFLARYAERYDDRAAHEAALRAADNVVRNQRDDGVYPYAVDRGTYPYVFDLPCVHYQGVTMYYLARANDVLREDWIDDSLSKGACWLADSLSSSGQFDWSGSGLSFAYHLSGAYAFAHASFTYTSRDCDSYREHADLCLNRLKECMVGGFAFRWEPGSWIGLPQSTVSGAKTALIGGYPAKYQAFRFGYAMYRQIARRRYAEVAETRSFEVLCRLLRIQSSTVEPSKNFPDLFMTSEVLDCLTQSWVWDGCTPPDIPARTGDLAGTTTIRSDPPEGLPNGRHSCGSADSAVTDFSLNSGIPGCLLPAKQSASGGSRSGVCADESMTKVLPSEHKDIIEGPVPGRDPGGPPVRLR